MQFHLPSFLLGCVAGATVKTLGSRLRPVAVELAAAAYQVLGVLRGHAARRREDLEDFSPRPAPVPQPRRRSRTVPGTEANGGRRIWVAHHLPGRTRLRIAPGPLTGGEGDAIADALSRTGGVLSVAVNRRAASALVAHEPEVDATVLAEAARAACAACREPLTPPLTSSVARELARLFRAINRDILVASDGRLDAGTLTTFGFLGAGALQVGITNKIGSPPWFNLAWWGFRTFITLEEDAIRASDGPAEDDPD